MKKITILICAIGALLTLLTFHSCKEDFLKVPPYGVYSQSQLVTKEAINNILMGCYSAITGEVNTGREFWKCASDAILGSVHGGEAMKAGPNKTDQGPIQELNEFRVTTGNSQLLSYWDWGFDAIYRCNFLLKQLEAVSGTMTEAEKTQVIAEARFLRAHYYFKLKRVFNNIPWIDETTDDVRQPNTVDNDGVTYVNIWPQIAADMDFARKNLPATQKDLGRPNKWAADAYYAKILMYRAGFGEYASGYTEALAIWNDVMANGVTASGDAYGLQPNYYWNFSASHENSEESVFACQYTINDGISAAVGWFSVAGKGNRWPVMQASTSSDAPGWGTGWSFFQPTQFFVDYFRTKPSGLPYLDHYETNANSIKSDYGIFSSEPFTIDTAGVDPRLDWTVLRRGIPALDYGINPGRVWIRNPEVGGPYLAQKYNVKDSEGGIYTVDKGGAYNCINYDFIRYADVLLFAAECEARVGSLDNARDLVNEVRDRMIQNSDSPDNWVKLDDGVTDAAHYRIGLYPDDGSADDAFTNTSDALDAILVERTLELGLEGHRFFDVIRFGKDEEIFPLWSAKEDVFLPGQSVATYTYTRTPDMWCPIPTVAIDNSLKDGIPTLTQNPGY